MKKKFLALILAAAMMGTLLTGCGTSKPAETDNKTTETSGAAESEPEETQENTDPVKLTIMGGAQLVSVAEVVLKDYLAEHTNVSINFEKYSYAEYPTKMKVQLSGGDSTPDIMLIHDLFASQFVRAGYLEDLSGLFSKDEVLPIMGPVTDNGKVYGLPNQVTNEYAFVYRSDIFDQLGLQVPTTFDEYFNTALKLKEAGYYAGAFDPSDTKSFELFKSFVMMLGGNILDDNGEVTLDKAKEAMELIKKCVDAGIWHTSTESDSEAYWTAFNAGKIACTPCIAAHASYYESKVDPNGNGGYGKLVVTDPISFSADGRKNFIFNTEYYCINAKSKYKEAAKDIVSYLALSEEADLKFSNVNEDGVMAQYSTGSIAGLKAVANADLDGWKAYGGQNVVSYLAKSVLDTNPEIPYVDERSNEINTIIAGALGEVFLNGRYTIDEAVDIIKKKIKEI